MRPVARGAAPGTYADHTLAKQDLVTRLGNWCSYCERPLPEDVEHVLPKQEFPLFKLDWTNFLLACKSCNDTKKNQQKVASPPDAAAELDRFLWPDRDNTARAFNYARTGVAVNGTLSADIQARASATQTLTGFHKTPGSPNPPDSPRDQRWKLRDMAWTLAEKYRAKLQAEPGNTAFRAAVIDLAGQNGFWSVWRTVFAADLDMLTRLNQAFAGTAPDAFDPATQALVPRPAGRC